MENILDTQTKNETYMSNQSNEETIVQAMQEFGFDQIPKHVFEPLKDYLINRFENENTLNIYMVKNTIEFMDDRLGGIQKELIRNNYNI